MIERWQSKKASNPEPPPAPPKRVLREDIQPPTSETLFDFKAKRDQTLPFVILGSFIVGLVIGLLF